jgi:hypothetical protein
VKLFLVVSRLVINVDRAFTYEQIIRNYYIPGYGDIVIFEDNKVVAIIRDENQLAKLVFINGHDDDHT